MASISMNQQSNANVMNDHLLTEPEVCEYLRIKQRQLYTWRMEGLIPYIKIGKALRFRKCDVDAALKKMTMGA